VVFETMALKNRRIFELRLGKLGLVLFISGMSLLLFSFFLIGVVVGKHMEAYPERYSSGLTELIHDGLVTAPPKARGADTQDVKEEKLGLTFYETLGGDKGTAALANRNGEVKNKKSEIPAGQLAPPANVPETELPTVIPRDTVNKTAPTAPIDQGGLKKQTPSAEGLAGEAGMQKPAVSPVPTPTAPKEKVSAQADTRRFEIQVAAYREKRQAEQIVKKLKDLGFLPHVVMKDLPGKGRWFRVIVDGFESKEKAREIAGQMAGQISGLSCVIRASGSSGN
jgi:cell division septation protein DedD